jgi:hypothetical protein
MTYSSPDAVPGIYTVELDGLARTEPTALRRDALRSLSSLVCCASLRSTWMSWEMAKGNGVQTLLNDRCERVLLDIAFGETKAYLFLPGGLCHRVENVGVI